MWVSALRSDINAKELRVRDVLAIHLPFVMTGEDAIDLAKGSIPDSCHDHTWLLTEPVLERSLSIPISGEDAFVFVFDPEGRTAVRVRGEPTGRKLRELREVVDGLR